MCGMPCLLQGIVQAVRLQEAASNALAAAAAQLMAAEGKFKNNDLSGRPLDGGFQPNACESQF